MSIYVFKFIMGRATLEFSLEAVNRFEAYSQALNMLPVFANMSQNWMMIQFARQDATGLTKFPIPC